MGRVAALCAVAAALLTGVDGASPRSESSCGDALGGAKDLPVAESGGFCGAGLAICPPTECCDQYGICNKEECLSTCQCDFSGAESNCPGSTHLSNVGIPVADPGEPCGPGVATCPEGECCGLFGTCSAKMCELIFCGTTEQANPADCSNPVLDRDPDTIQYEFDVSEKVIAPDGFERPAIVINGEYPGPTVECELGDRLIVKVSNNLKDPITVHWHGQVQRGTNIMDGVSGVTQRGQPPSTTQVYDFKCQTGGSYWYHSHYKTQYMDGLRGGLVTHSEARGIYPADSLLQLSDWYHLPTQVLIKTYLNPASGGDEPVPMSALMNAHGQFNCTKKQCDYTVAPAQSGGTCANPTTKIRIVNTSGFARFGFSVDDHRLIVTGVDGLQVIHSDPLRVVNLNVGQRIAVILCPDEGVSTEPGSVFWMRGKMDQSVFADPAPKPVVRGILKYFSEAEIKELQPKKMRLISLPSSKESNTALPTTKAPKDVKPAEVLSDNNSPTGATNPYAKLTGTEEVAVPEPDLTIPVQIQFYNDPTPKSINWAHFALGNQPNISFRLPNPKGLQGPTILEWLTSGTPLPPNENFGLDMLNLKEGQVIEMTIDNYDTGEHPLHMHGHWMFVMARGLPGDGTWAENKDKTPYVKKPLLRDTVTVNANSFVVVRFITDNPGAWIFHCHIDWHLEAGLAFVINYGVSDDAPIDAAGLLEPSSSGADTATESSSPTEDASSTETPTDTETDTENATATTEGASETETSTA